MTDDELPETTESKKTRPSRASNRKTSGPKVEAPSPTEPAEARVERTAPPDGFEEPRVPPHREPPPRRSPEPWHAEDDEEPPPERTSRLYRLGRKLLDRGDDVRELASTFLETGDRAKSEAVRMMAREVRNYLDELRLKESLLELIRSHSLEMKISLHLKPLAEAGEGGDKPKPSGSGSSK